MSGRGRVLLSALFLSLLAALSTLPLLAHGGGVPRLTAAPVGDYLVYAWVEPAEPRAGEPLHITVGVTLPQPDGSEIPVTDATVTVLLAPERGESLRLVTAPDPMAGGVYLETDGVPPSAGAWQVTVEVAGAGEASFVMEVASAGGDRTEWLAGGALVALLTGSLAAWFARRKRAGQDANGYLGAAG